ncbi:hypothetical protein DPMN_083293 [Dreissena polymorpha]|uniref:Uncharacterized protein n=1 Tax=Dreissena polymorpha TaxID=45954 RepID=A0A9D3YCB9_DREPO|nr:hypothetical protein DPMN_083293 [Dreissena polymorpha]
MLQQVKEIRSNMSQQVECSRSDGTGAGVIAQVMVIAVRNNLLQQRCNLLQQAIEVGRNILRQNVIIVNMAGRRNMLQQVMTIKGNLLQLHVAIGDVKHGGTGDGTSDCSNKLEMARQRPTRRPRVVEIDGIVIRDVQYQFEFQCSCAYSVGGESGQDGRKDRRRR